MKPSRLLLPVLLLGAWASSAAAQTGRLANVPVAPGPITACPSSLALDESNGFGYVAYGDTANLTKINLSTGAVVQTIALPDSCPNGVQMVISDLGGGHKHLWILTTSNQVIVVEIDPALTFAVITGTGSLALPANAGDMVADSDPGVQRVFLAVGGTNQIVGFQDSASHGGSICPCAGFPITLGTSGPLALAIATTVSAPGNRLYVAGPYASAIVYYVNTTTGASGTVAIQHPSCTSACGSNAYDVAFDGVRYIYSAVTDATFGDYVAEIDTQSATQTARRGIGAGIGTFYIHDLVAYRASDGASRVLAVRGPNGTDGGGVCVGMFPMSGGLPSGGGSVLANYFLPAEVKLDITSGSPGDAHQNLAVDAPRDRMFLIHNHVLHVHAFDALSGSYQDLFPGFEEEGAVAVDPTAGRIYSMLCETNSLLVHQSAAPPTFPTFVKEIVLPGDFVGLAPDPTTETVLLPHSGPSQVAVQGTTNASGSFTLPGGVPLDGVALSLVHPTSGWAYLIRGGSTTVFAVNLSTKAVTSIAVPFAATPDPEFARGAALDASRNRLYVGASAHAFESTSSGDLFVIDTNPASATFNQVLGSPFVVTAASFPCDFRFLVVNPNDGFVFALDRRGQGPNGPARVFKIDGTTGTSSVISTFTTSDNPKAMAINPSSTPPKVYVKWEGFICSSSSIIRILNAATGGFIADLDVGIGLTSDGDETPMAVNPATGRLFVSLVDQFSGVPTVSVVETNDTVGTPLAVGAANACTVGFKSENPMAFDSATGRLVLVNRSENGLYRFVDSGLGVAADTSVLPALTALPDRIAVNPASGLVYVLLENGSMDVYGSAPSISAFNPASAAGGATVSIFGANFNGATSVLFNSTPAASFTIVSHSRIDAVVPAGAPNGPLAVVTPLGSATSGSGFTFIPPPSISSFSPASGPAGASVTISGSGFTGATAVTFNGTSATFTVVSDTQITATVPAGATSGSILVAGPGGSGVGGSAFTVIPPPSIASFSPTNGSPGAGVSISGSGFTGATAVMFNGTTATFSVVSDSQISATVPASATTGAIGVTTPGGSTTSASSFTVTAAGPPPAPVVSSFSPGSGLIGSGLSIFGTDFAGATGVTLGGGSVPFSVISSTTISATVPAGAVTGPIAVTTPSGTGTSAGSFVVIDLLVGPGPLNPPSSQALPGTLRVPLAQMTLTALGADIRLNGFTAAPLGTINFATGIVAATLWVDVNANGVVDASDSLVDSGPFPFASGPTLVDRGGSGLGLVIPAGATTVLLFAVDLGGGVSAVETFAAAVSSFDATVVSGGASVPLAFSGTSAVLTVGSPGTATVQPVASGGTVDDYIMFAASIDAGSTGFDQIVAQFGAPGTTGGMRLFRYDPTTGFYDEFGGSGFASKYPTMNPAFGWWFIARNAGSLQLAGSSTAQAFPGGFSITLQPGWNQVGNPFDAPLPLALVEVGGVPLDSVSNAVTLPTVYRFQRGSYFAETAAMQPRVGYWMKNIGGSPCTVLFEKPPTALKAGSSPAASRLRALYAGEESPPPPPSTAGAAGLKSGGGKSGGGTCFAGGSPIPPWAPAAALLSLAALRRRRR